MCAAACLLGANASRTGSEVGANIGRTSGLEADRKWLLGRQPFTYLAVLARSSRPTPLRACWEQGRPAAAKVEAGKGAGEQDIAAERHSQARVSISTPARESWLLRLWPN